MIRLRGTQRLDGMDQATRDEGRLTQLSISGIRVWRAGDHKLSGVPTQL